jgi:hypothetical protein
MTANAAESDRREMAASRKAEAGITGAVSARKDAPLRSIALAECYRVESANGTPATWGTVPLPFVVALDTSGRSALVSAADGSGSGRAAVTRTGDDSLTFQLRRIGYTGTLTLGAAGDVRPGVMRSAPATTQLSQSVVTSAPADQDTGGGRRIRLRGSSSAPSAVRQSAPAAVPVPPENAGAPAIAVVARRVACAPPAP